MIRNALFCFMGLSDPDLSPSSSGFSSRTSVRPFETSANENPGHQLLEYEKRFETDGIFQPRIIVSGSSSRLAVLWQYLTWQYSLSLVTQLPRRIAVISTLWRKIHVAFSPDVSRSHTSGKVGSEYPAIVAPSNCATQNVYCPK